MFPIELGDPGADCAGDGGAAAGTAGASRAGRAEGRAGPEGQATGLRQAQGQAPAPTPSHTTAIATPSPVGRQKVGGGGPGGGHGGGGNAGGGLKGLSASLATSKGAKAKLEAKVSQWETKLAEVRAMGDEERILMADATLRKGEGQGRGEEEAIEALDRSVRRMKVVLARTVEKVKEEVMDEVVEVEVEAEEMEEGMV